MPSTLGGNKGVNQFRGQSIHPGPKKLSMCEECVNLEVAYVLLYRFRACHYCFHNHSWEVCASSAICTYVVLEFELTIARTLESHNVYPSVNAKHRIKIILPKQPYFWRLKKGNSKPLAMSAPSHDVATVNTFTPRELRRRRPGNKLRNFKLLIHDLASLSHIS